MKETTVPGRQDGVDRLHLDLAEGRQASWGSGQDLPRLFWERRRFLLGVASAGLLLAVAIALLTANRYQAMTRLIPSDNNATSSRSLLTALSSGNAVAFSGDVLGLRGQGAMFVGIFRSRTVQDRLVQEFELQKVYRARLREEACQQLDENTQISEDRSSGIITIIVTDTEPHRAAALAKAYVEQFNRLAAEMATSTAHRERVFLEGRLEEVKRDLDSASKELSEFSSQTSTIDIQEQGRTMVGAAATLQGHLIAAQSELEGLRQIYTENNVQVRSLRARVAELQKQLGKLGGPGGRSRAAQNDGQPYPSLRQLPLLGATYGDLVRRVKIEDAVYETLRKQYELARVEEAKEIPTVQVLDAAEAPERKSGPHRLRIVVFMTALSCAVGMFFLMAEARWLQMPCSDYRKLIVRAAVARIARRRRAG